MFCRSCCWQIHPLDCRAKPCILLYTLLPVSQVTAGKSSTCCLARAAQQWCPLLPPLPPFWEPAASPGSDGLCWQTISLIIPCLLGNDLLGIHAALRPTAIWSDDQERMGWHHVCKAQHWSFTFCLTASWPTQQHCQ